MESLVKRKGVIKGQITKIGTFVSNRGANASYDELSIRLTKLHDIYNQFVSVEDQIFQLDNSVATEMDSIDDAYFENVANIQRLIRDRSLRSAIPNLREEADTSMNTTQGNFRADFKLPRLNLPVFDGNVKQWQAFYDIYVSTVHENTSLSPAQKFKYLLGQLRGTAYSTICHFRVDDANYFEALKRLVKKYDRKRTIVESYIREFLVSPNFNKPTSASITKLYDTIDVTTRGLKALGDQATQRDPWIILLAADKLDEDSRQLWKYETADSDYPTIEQFLEFLSKRMNSLEETIPKQSVVTKTPKHAATSFYTTRELPTCPLCETEAHKLYECSKFREMSVERRREFISKSKRCFNCLSNRHLITSCQNRKHCQKCPKRHNTLLHSAFSLQEIKPNCHYNQIETDSIKTPREKDEAANFNLTVPMCQYPVKVNGPLLDASAIKTNIPILPTARVDVLDNYGNWIQCRTLLDSGSTHNFISETLMNRLKIPRSKSNISVNTVNQSKAVVSRGKSMIKLRSIVDKNYSMNLEAFVLPRISSRLPEQSFDNSLVEPDVSRQLADPDFHVAAEVELLLGCEVFFQVLLDGKIQHKPDHPCIQNSQLGWLVGGMMTTNAKSVPKIINSSLGSIQADSPEALQRLEVSIERFWRTEEVILPKPLTVEEQACVEFFNSTTKIKEGRIIVRIPFKENPPGLGESYKQALRRYNYLENKLNRDKEMKEAYTAFMLEYLKLDHMELISEDETSKPFNQLFYLPHHPVVKESSTTTKVRVVFDASAKSSNGYSLNDNLMIGPTIQDNLVTILIRFRKHKYILTADIEKMFRQISISKQDQDYHRVIWRESPDSTLKHYRLKTITYGTSPAPYLATASLHYLANKYESLYPEASKIIKNDLYMDDLMSGSHNLELALKLQSDIIRLLDCAGFNIRKWSSNHPSLLQNIPKENREISARELTDNSQMISVLGIKYNPNEDYFTFKVSLPVAPDKMTKRLFLSETSRIYDPLGLLSPITVGFKILFQSLWIEGIGWDEELPQAMLDSYLSVREQLKLLNQTRFPRWLFTTGKIELHGFADASKDAYAATIYSRTVLSNGEAKTNLIISKTRVAPIKVLTIPKLELNGATLLVRLLKLVLESLNLTEEASVHLYTDSTIVLQWLSKPPKILSTFQANRVAEIISFTNRSQWHFVPSHENPADKATRGVTPENFIADEMWLRGPNFLNEVPLVFPTSPVKENAEMLSVISNAITIQQGFQTIRMLCLRYSNRRTLTHVLAFILRFKNNLQARKLNRRSGKQLSVDEILSAEFCLFRFVQYECYAKEINCLVNNKPISSNSKILSFYPYIDNIGLLRMRGRLEYATISHDAKHPIIMPNDHIITEGIIREVHHKNLHAGPKLMLTILKQRFAIPRAKNIIRRITHRCITCRRFNTKQQQQFMGQLPRCRVNQSVRPFIEVGIDLAGPFTLKTSKGRGAKLYKSYLVIFVCMATKSTTIEIASDMSTDGFIASLKRFSSTRGLPQHIYCDNGSNLVGARREIQQLYNQFKIELQQTQLIDWCTDKHIQWHFIPPAAPNFGGLWEAAVKSCKYHLRRVIGEVTLTYEEFLTIIKQVEGLLNSRPLGELPEDEWNPLTPAHFLITQPVTMLPEPSLQVVKISHLSRWQLIQQMMQGFWSRWSQEYVTSLNKFYKWHSENHQFKLGDLVLLRDHNLPPSRWALARICEIHPGNDQLVRVVSLKLPSGRILKRPISKICLLPKFDSSESTAAVCSNN